MATAPLLLVIEIPQDAVRVEEPWTWAQVEIVGHRTHWGRVRSSDGWIEIVEPAVDVDAEPVGEPRRNDRDEWSLYLSSAPPEAMVQRYLCAVSRPEERHHYRRDVALFGLHETTEERVRAMRIGEHRGSEWRVVEAYPDPGPAPAREPVPYEAERVDVTPNDDGSYSWTAYIQDDDIPL